MELILASKSPRRCELLRRCGFDFKVVTADTCELTTAPDLRFLPEKNALLKARAVAEKYPDSLVLGADTMILFDGKAVGKPADQAEAARFLRDFSGRTHEVVTGLALCFPGGREESWHEVSQVRFKTLTETVIDEYLRLVPVLDKAGAYAIQEHGEMIIENFSGELENIIGLPLMKLQKKIGGLMDPPTGK